jgi:hypothetical protein
MLLASSALGVTCKVGFEIRLARHARERVALRGVSVGELEFALAGRPSYRDVSGAEVYTRKLNDHTLVVIAERVGGALKVITVYKAGRVDELIRSE